MNDHNDPTTEPFLEKGQHNFHDDNDDSHDGDRIEPSRSKSRSGILFSLTPLQTLFLHLALVLLYTSVFLITFFFFPRRSSCSSSNSNGLSQQTPHSLLYSPASQHITYHIQAVDGLAPDSIYAGQPTPESDDAWHNLMDGINMRVSHEEMARLGQQSLRFADGSGQLGTLGVYHELHCIKRVRKWFYRDYYYPNMTEFDYNERQSHADHCIELMRQSAICKGDTSVTAFEWLHRGNRLEPTTKEGTPHQCVDWEKLSSFARKRAVDLFDPELLEMPERE